jgi:hypothetical protein
LLIIAIFGRNRMLKLFDLCVDKRSISLGEIMVRGNLSVILIANLAVLLTAYANLQTASPDLKIDTLELTNTPPVFAGK